MNALSKVCRSGWPPVNSARAHLILSIVLTGALCEPVLADKTPSEIEVFIDSMNPVANYADGITVYYIDRIDRLQKELSIDLPADPEAAKQTALHRFQRIDSHLSSELENAAKGLVQAMQYGIDRYPAIVFDGKAVVYGITDVRAATQRYQQWQAGEARP
ncbi:MAG: TIGR03757 family integrating conjugative element protein [Haliea sp.]|nr:TIGR03757 family integrating conjugative element protein [Haliea sp.]MAY91472.1 TIGR03757 family integrating conjugative element protein [Haliea sp.]MBP68400.1 TIGR03757 family integrating conjugative element protein [Haliea sp.]